MNNKGFTLVELLFTILIIGIVSGTITVGVVMLNSTRKEKEYQEFKNTVEKSACTLVELSKYENEVISSNKTLFECRKDAECVINTSFLVKEGLLSEDLKNPKSNKTVLEESIAINITWSDGQKNCKIVE